MNKRYHAKHRVSRRQGEEAPHTQEGKSSFILRLNMCLGIGIVVIGLYQLNNSIGEKIVNHLNFNTTVDTMKSTADDIKNMVIQCSFGKEDFVPNDDTLDYINNLEQNSYYNLHQKEQEDNQWGEPVKDGVLTDVFGERTNPLTGKAEKHKGIDIGVSANSEALAVRSGVVVDLGTSPSYGNWLKYKTDNDYEVLYAHLNKVAVKKDEAITKGQVVAYTGSTGNSTGPHLHYEILKDGQNIDPYSYYVNN